MSINTEAKHALPYPEILPARIQSLLHHEEHILDRLTTFTSMHRDNIDTIRDAIAELVGMTVYVEGLFVPKGINGERPIEFEQDGVNMEASLIVYSARRYGRSDEKSQIVIEGNVEGLPYVVLVQNLIEVTKTFSEE